MHRRLLAIEIEKYMSLVSHDFPHLCVLTPKLLSGMCAVLPTPRESLGMSSDNARAIQQNAINLQAFTSTVSVSRSDPKSAEWRF